MTYTGVSGITPAYAGKSFDTEKAAVLRWDHPRLRGEKLDHIARVTSDAGSPPLTRGKDLPRPAGQIQIGITPAYAGKSGSSPGSPTFDRDHPRLRGEKVKHTGGKPTTTGSPPLTRGKVYDMMIERVCSRITPAYAGKSSHICFCINTNGDHPRLRGEKGTIC